MAFKLKPEIVGDWSAEMKELPFMISLERVPTADGKHHTSFLVVNDETPGQVTAFPRINFSLLSETLQREMSDEFKSYGFTFV